MTFDAFSASISHLGTSDRGKIARAFEFGKKAHDGQMRKSGEPYFKHPIATAKILAKMGADAETIIAALLHDSVEDTAVTIEDVHNQFGSTVGVLIDGVTKLDAREFQDQPALDEQMETLRKMFQLMQSDVRIMVIKLADRLHNMQTIEFLAPEKQQRIAKETMDVYVKIADRLCMQDLRDELEGLSLNILEPALFLKLDKQRKKNELHGAMVLRSMQANFLEKRPILPKGTLCEYEHYSWGHLRSQVEIGDSAVTGLASIALSFITPSIEACYTTLGTLHQHWQREFMSFQDHINTPIINGYQALHTTVILPDGTRVRCKIRTKEMHAYARQGITAICFQKNKEETSQYLPWTLRIAPLAEGTKDRSKDFWESLQSDILGESIVVHSKNDSSALIPAGATALDGVFFLFKDKALQCKGITINGKPVPFHERLTHAATLDIHISEENTIERNWLTIVKTGFAAASIRHALSLLPRKERLQEGMKMLETILQDQHHSGFIEELSPAALRQGLHHLSCRSLEDMYIAISEGRLDPMDAYTTIFSRGVVAQTSSIENRRLFVVRYTVQTGDIGRISDITRIHDHFQPYILSVRYINRNGKGMQVILRSNLTETEFKQLKQELVLAGGHDIESFSRTTRDCFLLGTIIVLWGLNPVLAQWFLFHGMSPLELTTIRLLTFCALSIGLYLVWHFLHREEFTKIRNISLIATPTALGFTGMSFFVYLAVSILPPAVHLAIMRLNPLLISFAEYINKYRSIRRRYVVLILTCILGGLTYWLSYKHAPLTAIGVSFSLLALCSYTFYSLAAERSMREEKISARFPLFNLNIGILQGIIGLIIAFFIGLAGIFTNQGLFAALYVALCVFTPHILYATLLKQMRFSFFTDYLLFEIPLAAAFEFAIFGSFLPVPTLVMLFAFISLLAIYRWRKMGLRPL